MAIMKTYNKFTKKKKQITTQVLDDMDSKATNATKNVKNLEYAQDTMHKAMHAMLKHNMVTMHKDTMSTRVEQQTIKNLQEYSKEVAKMSMNIAKVKEEVHEQKKKTKFERNKAQNAKKRANKVTKEKQEFKRKIKEFEDKSIPLKIRL